MTSSHFPTREQALQAINEAQNWPQLFEVTNRALSSGRKEWGDELIYTCYAAQLWGSAVFPITSTPQVQVWYKERHPKVHLSGQELQTRSFQMAKALATQLTGPLKNEEDWSVLCPAYPDTLLTRLYLGSGFVKTMKVTQDKTLRKSKLVRMERYFSWKALDAFLDGKAHRIDKRPPSKIFPETLVKRFEELEKHVSTQVSNRTVLEQLREEFGFQTISVGPLGGWSQVLLSCQATLQAFTLLADKAELHHGMIGLDGMTLQVNGSLLGALAHYSSVQNAMLVGRLPSGIAHEWGHALKKWTERYQLNTLVDQQNLILHTIHHPTELSGYYANSVQQDEKRHQNKLKAWKKYAKAHPDEESFEPEFEAYYQKRGELIARLVETYFETDSCPSLAQTQTRYESKDIYPQGAEKKRLHGQLKDWLLLIQPSLNQLSKPSRLPSLVSQTKQKP